MDIKNTIKSNQKSGEKYTKTQENTIFNGQKYGAVFYYKGNYQITGGLVFSSETQLVDDSVIAANVAQAIMTYWQLIKPASVAADKFMPGLADSLIKKLTQAKEHLASNPQAQQIISQIDSIIADLQIVMKTTKQSIDILNTFWKINDLPFETIKQLYNLHAEYQYHGRSYSEKMVTASQDPQFSKIKGVFSGATPANFSNSLATSVERELNLFMSGYRIPWKNNVSYSSFLFQLPTQFQPKVSAQSSQPVNQTKKKF